MKPGVHRFEPGRNHTREWSRDMYTHYLREPNGKPALMKDGTPFLYSTEWTARLAAKYLGMKNRRKYRVAKLPY